MVSLWPESPGWHLCEPSWSYKAELYPHWPLHGHYFIHPTGYSGYRCVFCLYFKDHTFSPNQADCLPFCVNKRVRRSSMTSLSAFCMAGPGSIPTRRPLRIYISRRSLLPSCCRSNCTEVLYCNINEKINVKGVPRIKKILRKQMSIIEKIKKIDAILWEIKYFNLISLEKKDDFAPIKGKTQNPESTPSRCE